MAAAAALVQAHRLANIDLQTDVDEGRLHPRQDPQHPPLVNVPGDVGIVTAVDVKLLEVKEKKIFVLPGPPREIESVWNHFIAAWLRQNVTLRLDPNDREYPFTGNSEGDFEWKLKRK